MPIDMLGASGLMERAENDDAIRDILERGKVKASDIGLDVVNAKEIKNDPSSKWIPIKYATYTITHNCKVGERHFRFVSQPINYVITSLGHEVGLKTEYPHSSLIKYEIKMLKSKNRVMKSQYTLT